MSGIGGHMTAPDAPLDHTPAAALAAALSHRGPDGEGRFVTGGLHLVHTRLSPAGDAEVQPIYLSDGAVLVMDGAAGHGSGGLGSETIVEAYRGDPLRFAENLSGAYAIALYDQGERSLLLARDALGRRPLYYAEIDGDLVFASEPRALVKSGAVKPRLRHESVSQLLQLQFTTGRNMPIEGIARVLPGEALLVRGGRIVERRRRPPLPGLSPLRIGEAEALSRLRETLGSAVRSIFSNGIAPALHLKASVGTAALLAAMIESDCKPPLIVAMLPRGFRLADHPISQIRPLLQTEYAVLEVSPDEIWHELPKMIASLDDPAADYSVIPGFLVAARIAQGLKAVIGDEGADEMFAGYGRYRAVTRRFLFGGRAMRSRGFLEGLGVLRDESPRWRDGIVAMERRIAEEPFTKVQAAQALDATDWLAHDVMLRLDRASSAHGLEAHTPFLDEAVRHLGFRLPDGLKIARGKGAHLLRRYAQDVLPRAVGLLGKQRGSWLEPWLPARASELATPLAALACIREQCRPEGVAQLLRRCTATANRRILNAAWQLLFYALWHRIHIEGIPAEGNPLEMLTAK